MINGAMLRLAKQKKTMEMTRGSFILLVLLCLPPQIAAAESTNLRVFGHELAIYENSQEGEEVLTVDKKELLKDHNIDIKEIGLLANAGFAIGANGSGGNACDEQLFVLSFVQGAPTRIDGPYTCRPVKYKVERDRIVVEEPPSPDADGSRWTWTANGFGPPETLKLAVTSGKGWNALRSRSIQHPCDLLRHEEFVTQFTKLLGQSRYSSVPNIFCGPGSVQYKGDVLVGEACQAHECDETSALVAIDLASQKVTVALKDRDNPPFVSPQDADWPAVARNDLREWRAKWRKQE